MSNEKKVCFVIMPFSKTIDKHTERYWTDHFQKFLKPLIEESGQLKARRSEALRGDILRSIITNLIVSPVVVADLTDFNPNVFWELGVRQSFKHGTITIAEEGAELPFDVFGKGTLFYHCSHVGNEEFYSDFKKAINHCTTNPDSPDSTVLETLSGRGTLFEIMHRAEILRRIDGLLSENNLNQDLILEVLEQTKENKKSPTEAKFVTSRFTSIAAEFLMTERYLNEDRQFYKAIEKCVTSVYALNDMLRNWQQTVSSTESWFEKNGNLYVGRFKTEAELLAVAQKKISEKDSNLIL